VEHQICLFVDIDGTLAKYPDPMPMTDEEWDTYFATAEVNQEVVNYVKELQTIANHSYILTARNVDYWDLTMRWLSQTGLHFDGFIMRGRGDAETPASVMKYRVLKSYAEDHPDSKLILIDDNDVTRFAAHLLGVNTVDPRTLDKEDDD